MMILASFLPLTSITAQTVEEISRHSKLATCISVVAMIVAILALILHYFAFKQLGFKFAVSQQKSSVSQPDEKKVEPPVQETVPSNVACSDGAYVAIAAAIHLYGEELHDVENTVLTINKVSRTYSPWSSKVHGLNTYFKR